MQSQMRGTGPQYFTSNMQCRLLNSLLGEAFKVLFKDQIGRLSHHSCHAYPFDYLSVIGWLNESRRAAVRFEHVEGFKECYNNR